MEIFDRVATNLEASLAEAAPQTQADKQKQEKVQSTQNKMPPMSHTLMDLVITISVYLPQSSFASLFQMAATMVNKSNDPQLQKKAYKLIPRLAESTVGKSALKERNGELQQLLLQSAETASGPARRDRLVAISQIVEFLPPSDLHFIPSILAEIVISAKEVNEKAREAAYNLLVSMGERMAEGGTVVQSKVTNVAADAPTVTGSLDEYFTMVSAGLVGTTPHMISASVTAVTRILFQFHDRISKETIRNLIDIMEEYLPNPNREIVRSVLGFVKVMVVSLPESLVRPRLKTLIPNLMVWSHEHKAHFKAKVKHIVERMIRKYGVEDIEKACPPEDRKLIANIRKTRERRKKKKADDGDEEEVPEVPKRKGKFESEFDEAVYGSESDDSEDANSEDEFVQRSQERQRGRGNTAQTYIIEDEDEPLDLLSKKALGNISSTKPLRLRTIQGKKTKVRTDEDGKLILGAPESDDVRVPGRKRGHGKDDDGDVLMGDDNPGDGTLEGGINAYVDAIRGRDAAQRGQKGKLKFSNRKQRGVDDGDDDSDGEKASRNSKSGSGVQRGGFKAQRRGLGVQKSRGGRVEKRGGRGGIRRGSRR